MRFQSVSTVKNIGCEMTANNYNHNYVSGSQIMENEGARKFRNLREEFAIIVLNVVEARRPHNQTIYPLLREPKTVSREQREGAEEREQEGEMKSKEYNISLHVFLAFLHTGISLFLAISHVNTLKS